MMPEPRRVYTPPARTYLPQQQPVARRSASPRPLRPIYHARTPSMGENDGSIVPSIEATDGVYISPVTHRNPFDVTPRIQPPNQKRFSGRNLIDLTNSAEQASKRPRISSSPPSPYLQRAGNRWDPQLPRDDHMQRPQRQLIDLDAHMPTSATVLSHSSAHQSAPFPPNNFNSSNSSYVHDATTRQEYPRYIYDRNDGATAVNVARSDTHIEHVPFHGENRVVYEAIDPRDNAIGLAPRRVDSPRGYVQQPSHDPMLHSVPSGHYVREPIPLQSQDVYVSSSVPVPSHVLRENPVHLRYFGPTPSSSQSIHPQNVSSQR